jgi:hypothetical protein
LIWLIVLFCPLTQGGGTNLKTAEALWSGKHIVATSIAMRGFENFIGQSGVHIADEPVVFKSKLREVMEMEPLILAEHEVDARRKVLWDFCLAPLLTLMDKIKKESSR